MGPIKNSFNMVILALSRRLKIDAHYVASGGFWMACGVVASGLIGLATATAFANLLPKEVYGSYQYVLATVGILGILGLPGLKTAISRAAARHMDGTFLDAVRARIRWSFLCAFAAAGVSAYYYLQGNAVLGSAFAVSACLLPWWEAYGSYVPYLQGKKRFDLMITYETLAQLTSAATLIAVMFLTDDLFILCGAFFASWIVARLFLFRRTLAQIPPNNERDPSLLGYGKHLSLMSGVGTIASNADKLLLWQFLGPVGLAVYTFALVVPQRGVSALASINRLYFPKAAVRDLQSIRVVLLRRVLILVGVALMVAVAYFFIAPFLFQILFPQYLEAVAYSQAAALLVALQPFSLFATTLSAHAKKRELYLYNIVPPFLQLLLLGALVPFYGLAGAIAALLVSRTVESVLVVILFFAASGNDTSSDPHEDVVSDT